MLSMFYNASFFPLIGCNFQRPLEKTWKEVTFRIGTLFFLDLVKDGNKKGDLHNGFSFLIFKKINRHCQPLLSGE